MANKVDSRHRVVSEAEGIAFANKYGFNYAEVSAKTGYNIYLTFDKAVKTIYEKMDKETLGPGIKRHFSYDENNV